MNDKLTNYVDSVDGDTNRDKNLRNVLEKDEAGVWGDDPENTEGVPVLRATNFAPDHIDLEDVAYRDIPDSKKDSKKLQYGDIVLERSGGSADQPVGRVMFYDLEGEHYPGNFLRLLRPDTSEVIPKYLYYQLEYMYRRGDTVPIQSNTTNIRNLQFESYLNQSINVPDLEKQEKVAEILTDIENTGLHLQKLAEQYDTIKYGLMQHLIGDIDNTKNNES